MKIYKQRPGVVLLEVCGESLLVSTREAREFCPYVTQLNDAAAALWRLLESENTLQSLQSRAATAQGKEEKALLLPVLAFLGKMSRAGYLLVEEQA